MFFCVINCKKEEGKKGKKKEKKIILVMVEILRIEFESMIFMYKI